MNTAELQKLSISERLQAMEAIWDSLLYEEAEIDSPDWHKEVLEERKRRIAEDTSEFVPIADLKKNK